MGRTGDPYIALNRSSAVHRCSEKKMSVNGDHSDIVKFSRDDADYHVIVSWLHKVATPVSLSDQSLSNDVAIESAILPIEIPSSESAEPISSLQN